ncbi:hypothetical protein [Nocardioides sp. L-11A]|uniref:hypothetical protein n=1 Tax=Nocardioides sp. L-11A TaxID=3043848 RepID=UPI002499CCEE|nr:hypothetical protein QJ852_01170 [Nocardioides sp. L-11A]
MTPELILDPSAPERADALRARGAEVIGALPGLARVATDAVVRRFSEEEPPPDELAEAAGDLRISAVEVVADGSVVLHLDDSCGEHFLDGYWPAVRLGPTGEVVAVTVES